MLFLQSYSVADVVSDPAEAPRISTADFAQVVQDAAGVNAEGERVTAVAPGRIAARASAASHERIKQVLADFRRIQPRQARCGSRTCSDNGGPTPRSNRRTARSGNTACGPGLSGQAR